MIYLRNEQYLAEGGRRKCYYHPDDDGLCIKILKIPGNPCLERTVKNELMYSNKIKNRDISTFDYLFYARYHGPVETNFGTGHAYDLIRDETTQNVSLTLRHYLDLGGGGFNDMVMKEALTRLKEQMITHKVFFVDSFAENLCCRILSDDSMELVIVDGLGHRDFIPLVDYFHYFAKNKVERCFLKRIFDKQRDSFNRL